MLFLLQLTSFFVLTALRYKNQGLNFEDFNISHTGNAVTIIFFCLFLIVFVFALKNYDRISFPQSLVLIILSLVSIAVLLVSYYLSPKDEKVIYSAVFILLNIFIVVSLLSGSISKRKAFTFFSSAFITLVMFALIVFYVFYKIYTFADDENIIAKEKINADAGVILGAAVWGGNRPSPVLRERINKGYELYEKKSVNKLVLTGGGSPNEMTEADVAKNELLKYGVQKENLIVENTSNSTIEQILFVRNKLYKKFGWKKIILVSDNYHLLRAGEICRFNNMDCYVASSDTPVKTEGSAGYMIKETFALLFYWIFGFG